MTKLLKVVPIVLVLIMIMSIFLTSCNKQIFDTTWEFDYAYIQLPNGKVVEGKVEKWDDWDNSDVVQIKINGVWYLTHYSNVVLIDK